jgi:hypothetical protein
MVPLLYLSADAFPCIIGNNQPLLANMRIIEMESFSAAGALSDSVYMNEFSWHQEVSRRFTRSFYFRVNEEDATCEDRDEHPR